MKDETKLVAIPASRIRLGEESRRVKPYTLGWNDRVHGWTYLVFRSNGGHLTMNIAALDKDPAWDLAAREEYVTGWDAAHAAILALEIKS